MSAGELKTMCSVSNRIISIVNSLFVSEQKNISQCGNIIMVRQCGHQFADLSDCVVVSVILNVCYVVVGAHAMQINWTRALLFLGDRLYHVKQLTSPHIIRTSAFLSHSNASNTPICFGFLQQKQSIGYARHPSYYYFSLSFFRIFV